MLLFPVFLLKIQSSKKYESLWGNEAVNHLSWDIPFKNVYNNQFGSDKWFYDGKLNACYNCIDRWVTLKPDKTAIIYDKNDGETETFTYLEAQKEILKICNKLKHFNLKPGDCVTIYMPMSPNAIFSLLACARLGLVHNAVFGGFTADSLRTRLIDSSSKLLITQDYSLHDKKQINFIKNVSLATENINQEIKILIYDSANFFNFPSQIKRNIEYEKIYNQDNCIRWSQLEDSDKFVTHHSSNAEDPLFYLYTSGSTGKPKGIIHTTGGYLVYAATTLKYAFDIRVDDVFCCTADIGWITGHTYGIYGPLILGITTVILQGTPLQTKTRLFEMVDKYKITQLYTAPTVIRALKAAHEMEKVDLSKYDLSSLRTLGSVGEPLNEEAHKFYSESFGNLPVIDTYFQTETGGIIIAPTISSAKLKKSLGSFPLPGIKPRVVANENIINSSEIVGKLYIKQSWPGIARGILNDRERFIKSYFETGEYCTGDECRMRRNEEITILGRVDDVINVSGHRISTAEIENIVCAYENTFEAAVVAVPHEIKGQCMVIFVVLKNEELEFENKIKSLISEKIGGFCRPEKVISVPGILKTATGKQLRHALRKILAGEEIKEGDFPTCINQDMIEPIKMAVRSCA